LRLSIAARHAELSEEIRAFANEKVERLGRHFDRLTEVQLILSAGFVAKRPDGGDSPVETCADGEDGDVAAPPGDDVATRRRDRVRSDAGDVTGRVATAELVVTVPREQPFVANARGENFQAAIDLAVDKMDRQLRRHKERVKGRKRESR